MRKTIAVLFAFAAACASQGPVSDGGGAPEVRLIQMSSVPDVLFSPVAGLPMEYRLEIDNPFDYPVTLVSVEIESVGLSGAYAMKRVRHGFERVIPARSRDSIDLRAWVQRLQEDMRGDSDTPVLLRGTARFETATGVRRRNFVARGQ